MRSSISFPTFHAELELLILSMLALTVPSRGSAGCFCGFTWGSSPGRGPGRRSGKAVGSHRQTRGATAPGRSAFRSYSGPPRRRSDHPFHSPGQRREPVPHTAHHRPCPESAWLAREFLEAKAKIQENVLTISGIGLSQSLRYCPNLTPSVLICLAKCPNSDSTSSLTCMPICILYKGILMRTRLTLHPSQHGAKHLLAQ